MSRFIIIKAGATFPNISRKYGDFEDWTRQGLGVPPEQVLVFDAIHDHCLPCAKEFDGVVVTGSHSMVTDGHDWSERLIKWIAKLVDSGVPFLGICYGHQLLTRAAGGTVGYHPQGQEIGTVDIELLPESSTDQLFQGLPSQFPVHTTHSQTVLSLPSNAIRLAANAFEKCHAIRIGECAWGVQFHPEYDTHIMNSYIEEQAGKLESAGRNLTEIYGTVRETPQAATILRKFAEICKHGDQ
ncbi:glutamine amidotransferase [Psychromonas sp.]|uniref:glutamine amidotransferase n=1 Tax=Psychromonas sp. TaxID=1884585 RepID=UPI003569AE0F